MTEKPPTSPAPPEELREAAIRRAHEAMARLPEPSPGELLEYARVLAILDVGDEVASLRAEIAEWRRDLHLRP